jgi:hypothetical protein
MDSLLSGYLSFGLTMLSDMKRQNKAWKDRIRKQWKESQNLPRKKKKSVRKNLLLEWQIANYDPMGLYDNDFDEILTFL